MIFKKEHRPSLVFWLLILLFNLIVAIWRIITFIYNPADSLNISISIVYLILAFYIIVFRKILIPGWTKFMNNIFKKD